MGRQLARVAGGWLAGESTRLGARRREGWPPVSAGPISLLVGIAPNLLIQDLFVRFCTRGQSIVVYVCSLLVLFSLVLVPFFLSVPLRLFIKYSFYYLFKFLFEHLFE